MIGSQAQGARLKPQASTACLMLLLAAAAPAAAQTRPASSIEGRLELAAGGGFFGGSTFGGRDANLRSNDAQASPFRLFSTDTKLAAVPFFEALAAYRITRRLDVEGRLTRSRPELRTSLSADAEGATSITAVESLDDYLIEVGVAFVLDELRFGQAVPYVSGGLGYVRQLHEGMTLVEQGRDYYLGGGVRYPFVTRAPAKLKVVGVRAEAMLRFLDGDVVFNAVTQRVGFSGSIFVGF